MPSFMNSIMVIIDNLSFFHNNLMLLLFYNYNKFTNYLLNFLSKNFRYVNLFRADLYKL